MASKIELENKLISLFKNMEFYEFSKDYAKLKESCIKGMKLTKEIGLIETDYKRKQLMKTNYEKLSQKLDYCNKKLEINDDNSVASDFSSKSQTPSSTIKVGQRVGSDNKKKKGDSSIDPSKNNFFSMLEKKGITFDINGINVKQFLTVDSNEDVTFNDVKGMKDEKKLIENEFFLDDETKKLRERLGIKNKNFILLYGVPGTGKTFFAKAISTELKNRNVENDEVYFFSVVCTQLKDAKVGQSEKNIQAVFEFLKQFKHAVLFLDEFEAVAPDRKQNNGDPTADTCVTTLLQMMDGFSSSKGTLVIGATNCPYNLDGAVISRANLKIEIPLPDQELIYLTLKNKIGNAVKDDVNLSGLANRLVGYSNRDIKNLIANFKDGCINEFIRLRSTNPNLSQNDIYITNEIIEESLKKVKASTKPSDLRRIEEFKINGE